MRLLFAGDVMFGRLVNEYLAGKPPETPWSNTLQVMRTADLRVCNLECVISDRGEPWSVTPKVFHFRTDARNVQCLKAAGINGVSLANNHALDYGYEAASDMISILDREGIAHAGYGNDAQEALRPAFMEAEGTRVAMLSFTDNEPAWEAGHERPGINYAPVRDDDPRARRLFRAVEETKKQAGIVIVAAHWGPNWGYTPVADHVPFAKRLIDSGADIVFGHSCHVFQGIEIYKERPIIYSAGNFVDDYAVDEVERNDESFMFMVETEGTEVKKLVLHPTMIIRFQARLAKGFLAEEISIKMKRLCAAMGTRARLVDEDFRLEIAVK